VRHFFHFQSINIENCCPLRPELQPRVGWQIANRQKSVVAAVIGDEKFESLVAE